MYNGQPTLQLQQLLMGGGSGGGGRSYSSGYSGGGSTGTYSKTDMSKAANQIYDELAANSLGDAYNWLAQNQSQLRSDLGDTEVNKLFGKMNNALTKTGQQYGRGGYVPEDEDPLLNYMTR
jgi:hypothetical protein